MADSRVLATTRRIHIRLRVAVLRDSSHFRRFRPARPYETAVLFQNLVSVGFPLGFQPRPSKRYAFFGGYAARNKAALGTSGRVRRGARAAMLRRRDTVSSPCDVSHRASDEPRRCMSLSSALAPSSLASPSIRRVFVRSFCARRRPVSSLNRAAYPPERSGVAEGELNAGCKSVAPSWRISEASASPRQIRRDFVRTIISFHRALILLFDGERANVV